MKLTLADQSQLNMIGNREERQSYKGVYRDGVRFIFDASIYTDTQLREIFTNSEKTQTMTIDEAEKSLKGYTMFVRSVYEDAKISITMVKVESAREVQLMQETETQARAIAEVIGDASGDLLATARAKRTQIESASTKLTDEEATDCIWMFPEWIPEAHEYTAGDRVQYSGLLYRCLTDHTSQENWIPDVSPSLWVRIDDPAVEWPAWRQPVGSTDAYPMGAKVSHGGKRWTSDVDANIWEPPTQWTEVVE